MWLRMSVCWVSHAVCLCIIGPISHYWPLCDFPLYRTLYACSSTIAIYCEMFETCARLPARVTLFNAVRCLCHATLYGFVACSLFSAIAFDKFQSESLNWVCDSWLKLNYCHDRSAFTQNSMMWQMVGDGARWGDRQRWQNHWLIFTVASCARSRLALSPHIGLHHRVRT